VVARLLPQSQDGAVEARHAFERADLDGKVVKAPNVHGVDAMLPPIPMARLIIVEDNHELAALIAAAARGRGHTVLATHTGQSALEVFALQSFDLAVVDLFLPDMSGGRVLYEAGKHNTATVVMSGVFKGTRFAKEALEVHGAKAFFEKPFEMRALLDEIDRLVGAPPRDEVEDLDDMVLEELSPIEDEHGSFILPTPTRPPGLPPPPPPDADDPEDLDGPVRPAESHGAEGFNPGGLLYPINEEETKPPSEPDPMDLTRNLQLPARDFVETFAGAQALPGATPPLTPEEPDGQLLVLTEEDKAHPDAPERAAARLDAPAGGTPEETPLRAEAPMEASPSPGPGSTPAPGALRIDEAPPAAPPAASEAVSSAPLTPLATGGPAAERQASLPTSHPEAVPPTARNPVLVLPSAEESQAAQEASLEAVSPATTVSPDEAGLEVPFARRDKVWSTPEKKAPPPSQGAPSGTLDGTAVPRLLTAHYQARHSGELRLRQGNVVKVFYFDKGQPTYAASNLSTERFGRFSLRQGVITAAQLEEVARIAKEQNLRTAEAMMKLGLLTAERRRELVSQQVREIIWSTFSWREGEYTFAPKRPPSAGLVKLSVYPGNLILQGVQRTETLVTLRQKVPPKRRYVPTADPPYELHQISLSGGQALLLAHSDGSKTVEDLLSLSDLAEKEALATLVGFELLGLLSERRDEGRSGRITFGF